MGYDVAKYEGFGKALAGWRAAAGLPQQADLAEKLGAAQQTISRWERGESRPRADQIPALAKALGVDSEVVLIAAGYAPKVLTTAFDQPFPVDSLTDEGFERFCFYFLEKKYPGAQVHRAGGKGHTQDGIDVDVVLPNGKVLGFQCKREQQFGPQKVHTAVAKFKRKAARKVILLGRIASPQARQAIGTHSGWDLWDKEDISREVRKLSKDEQRQLVDTFFRGMRLPLLGETESGPWMTTVEFFAPFLNKKGAFGHAWELVGRKAELDALVTALDSRTVTVTRLIGAGGHGKTRLLREVLDRYQTGHRQSLVRILSATGEVTQKSLDDLGTGEKLLVVDDCHDHSDLGVLFQYVADDSHRARLLLSLRSYGADLIEHQASQFGFLDDRVADVVLKPLGLKEATDLAREVLREGNGPESAAAQIAKITLDCPLSTVMAAYVIAKDGGNVELAKNAKAFRQTLMSRFFKVAAGSIGAKGDEASIKKLLGVFALIQPVNLDDDRLPQIVKHLEGLDTHETARLVRIVNEGGVLFKRGGRYRLSPDLLADAIIEDACIAADGRSTGYAEKVFDAVDGSQSLENLIVNLGRLDWRRNDGDPSESRLLDGIWAKLKPVNDDYDPHLKAVTAVAYYQPQRALSFVAALMQEGRLGRGLAEILRYVAYNFAHLKPACECLWELAKSDTRETNPRPEHPIRVLSELCEVKPEKPRDVIETVTDFGLSLLEIPDSWSHKHTPFDFLKPVLEPDGHIETWGGRALTLEQFSVNLAFVRPLRSKLIEKLLSFLPRSDFPRATLLAARMLHEAVRYPTHASDRTEWDAAICETMERLKTVLKKKTIAPVVLLQIIDSVSWHAQYGDGTPKKNAQDILDLMPESLEFRTTMALVDGYGRLHNKLSDDPMSDAESNAAAQKELASELKEKYPSGEDLRVHIEALLSDIRRHCSDVDSAPRTFLWVLARENAAFTEAWVGDAVAGGSGTLAGHADVGLGALMMHDRTKAMSVADKLLASNDWRKRAAVGYAYGLSPATREFDAQTIAQVRTLLADDEPDIVFSAIAALRAMLHEPRVVLDLATAGNIGASTKVADQALMLLRLKGELAPKLTRKDVEKILAKLEGLEKLDGHWIEEFLSETSKAYGSECAEFFIKRVDRAVAAENWKLRPCNHGPYVHIPLKFRESTDFPKVLSRVVNWLYAHKSDSTLFRLRSAELFGAMFAPFDAGLVAVLRKLAETANETELDAIARIVGDGPSWVVLMDRGFVVELLGRCRQFGGDCSKRATSQLYGAAISGMRSGTPGMPFQKDLEMRDNAKQALQEIPRFSPGYDLYEALLRHAEEAINRAKRDGEELDDE